MSHGNRTPGDGAAPLSPDRSSDHMNGAYEGQRSRHGSGDHMTSSYTEGQRSRHGSGPVKSHSQGEVMDGRHSQMPKGSKSVDSADSDALNTASSMKRMTAVTDLDQAMKDRDKHILNKRFGTPSKQGQEMPVPLVDNYVNETDLDVDDTPASRYRSPGKFPDRSPKSPEGGAKSPSSPHFFGNSGTLSPVHPRVSSPHSPLQSPGGERGDRRPDHVRLRDHRPPVSLEDAVRWPFSSPAKLDFSNIQVFEGMSFACISVFQLGQNRRALRPSCLPWRPSCSPWRPSCPPLRPSALPCALLAPLMSVVVWLFQALLSIYLSV